MQRDIERILIDRHAIAQRLDEIASQIMSAVCPVPDDAPADWQRDAANGVFDTSQCNQITLVPILTGSIIFVADLIRRLPLYMQINVMSVSSYPGSATTSQGATINKQLTELPESLAGKHVLLIDDILDSGNTLRLVTHEITKRKPASLRTCVLLRKQRPEAMALSVDYVCFDIPDEFVVGYGLDYNDYYRNLPDIVTLTPEAIAAHDDGTSS